MEKRITGDRFQRYSLRKLSVGLVSATIGSFFFSTAIAGNVSTIEAAEVSARQTIPVQYHYVVESELTEAEKNAVVKELPKFVEENSDAYYLVYRPKTQGLLENNLPRTGYSSLWEATFAVAGLILAVLVIARGRNGKRYLSSILLVTGLGSILLAPSVFAVTNNELAAYNQRLNLSVGDKLPEPLEITGFEYVGYLKSGEQVKENAAGNHQLPMAQKDLSAVEVNKQAGKSVSFSENTSTPNKPVSTETEKLTEQEKAVAVKERESDRRFPVTELPELQLKSQDSTQTQVLPYQTEYQYSNELAEGQSQVIRAGVAGTRTVVTRNYIAGKEIVKSEVISDQVTAEPVSEIILVGTAAVKSVPKEAPVQEAPELTNYGTTPETAPLHEVPELTNYGTAPETAPVQEVPELTNYGTSPETAPVHEVPELTNYGTSPETAPVQEVPELTTYGTAPDTAPVQEVPELTAYGTTPDTAPVQEVPELTTYGTSPETAPVHEVPELTTYGTSPDTAPIHENSKLELTTNDEVRIEKIDFSIEEQYTDEIPDGSRKITTLGVQGERTIKTRVYSSNGQVIDRQELSNEETLAPVTQIVKVGTAKPSMVPNDAPKADTLPEYPLTYTDETRVEKVAFTIEEQYTDELPQNARQIATPGVQGERTIKTRVYSSNGQEIDRQELSNKETLAPVTQIVKVGTAKPNMVPNDAPKADALPEYPLTYTDETRVEKINFTIREEETDELVQDARQIATPGVEGERTIKTRVYSSNGQEIDRQELSNEETLAPVTQVVKVGTAKPSMIPNDAPKSEALPEYPLTYTDEIRVEKVAFNTEEQYTDELVRDARQIATPGVQGERTIKTRIYSSNGQVVDRQELSNEETLAPVTQIVKVGTAKPTMVPNEAPKAEDLEEFDLIPLHNLLAEANQIKAQARYFNDSQSHQSNYDTALMAGQAILSQSQASQAEVNQLVEQINQAKAQLSGLEVVKTALQTEYDLNPTVKTSVKYKNADSDKQTAYTDELTKADKVLNNQTAT
ncbi:IgA-specific zinc metalloproteinase [Streptococcus gordonii]|nr:IgA-specific zinc metalloproteinase [Streptococcus gordonii]